MRGEQRKKKRGYYLCGISCGRRRDASQVTLSRLWRMTENMVEEVASKAVPCRSHQKKSFLKKK